MLNTYSKETLNNSVPIDYTEKYYSEKEIYGAGIQRFLVTNNRTQMIKTMVWPPGP